MSLNDSIVSLYKENKLEKSIAYQLLSQIKEMTSEAKDDGPVRKSTEFSVTVSEEECLAFWCYFVSILENQLNYSVTVIEHDTKYTLELNIQEDMSFNELIEHVISQKNASFQADNSSSYLFVNNSKVDTGIASNVCILKQDTIELQCGVTNPGKTKFDDWKSFFSFLLPQMQQYPNTPINELDQLPPKHKALLENYNRTYMTLPESRTLGELLVPAIDKHKDTLAIKTTHSSIKYDQVKTDACRLANLLRKLGVKPNQLVPVICQRNAQMPVTLYGVALSGGAYVPLEPDNPADRIESILKDSKAEVLVTDLSTLSAATWNLNDTGIKHIVCIDGDDIKHYCNLRVSRRSELLKQKSDTPKNINKPEDLCYVIFTSGSTGKPKGVMISHENIVNTLIGVNNQYNVNAQDRILCFSSYSFDLSVWDIFGGFLAGAQVFIPTKQEIKDPKRLIEIIEKQQITIWDSVPTGMSQMLIPLLDKNDTRVNESLRLAMLSGEFIPLNLPGNIHRYFPNCKVSSLGGATEGTVWSIFYCPVENIEDHWKSIPYGHPLGNQRFYVLNEAMNHCAIGQKGMLYIAGLGVAKGYYGDPEKTKNAFIPCPWPSDMGTTIYKTGDLGVLNANGVIEIVGRADYQVKVRGFRVELGEVETQLSGLSAIDQAAVIAKPDEISGNKLIAFYTSSSGEITADQVKAQLGESLPQYMMPSQFVYLENPPVGTTGKLDRKALANWEVSRSELSQDFIAATTEEESKLTEALKGILNIDEVGVEDDFFLIGGDSLLSLQYLSALNNLGYNASPALIMEGRTIRNILQLVKDAQGNVVESSQAKTAELGPMPSKFINRMPLVNRNHWNQSIQIRMNSIPDQSRLKQAIAKVCGAHQMLKAGLDDSTQNKTTISDTAVTELLFHDLRGTNPFTKSRKLKSLIYELQSSLSIMSDSVSKAMVVVLSDNDIRFVWAVNHLVVDAHSWRILIEDLATAYQTPDSDLPMESAYADYVASVHSSYDDAVREHQDVWLDYKNVQRLELPKDFNGTNNEGDINTFGIRFKKSDTRKILDAVSAKNGVNLHLLTLTSIVTALRQWSGHNQVTLDVISNGRDIDTARDFSRTVGWFATHNPFKAVVDNNAKENLKTVQEQWSVHQLHCKHFVEACNRANKNDHDSLNNYQDNTVLYNFLGMFDNLSLPGNWQVMGSAGQDRAAENQRTHELEFEILVAGGSLMIQIHYSRQQFRKNNVSGLGKQIQTCLLSLALTS